MRLSQLLQFQKTLFESILFKISVRKFWIQNNSFPQLCANENGINNIDLQLIGRHQSTFRKPHQSGALFASVRSIPKEQWYRQAYFFFLPSPPPFPSFALAPTLRVAISTLPNFLSKDGGYNNTKINKLSPFQNTPAICRLRNFMLIYNETPMKWIPL